MTIEELKKFREIIKNRRAYFCDRGITAVEEDRILYLIDAEIARQSITDEDVKRAIEFFTCSDGFQAKEMHDLAITALEQMRTEPCEWCLPSEQERYKGVRPLDFISFMEFDGWEESRSKIGKNFCPNCGRALKGENNGKD